MSERCPACDGELRLLGLFLSLRDEDQKRVCRAPMHCPACDEVWNSWSDRPGEFDPDPMPEWFKRIALRRKP